MPDSAPAAPHWLPAVLLAGLIGFHRTLYAALETRIQKYSAASWPRPRCLAGNVTGGIGHPGEGGRLCCESRAVTGCRKGSGKKFQLMVITLHLYLACKTRLCMKWLSILITPGKKDSKSVSQRKFPKATGIDTHVEIAHAGMFYWRTILISLLSGAPISTQKWRYSRLLEHQQIIGASCFWMSFFLFCC